MIKTSIIIPVYNTSSYLEECVDSVFNQTQKEIEVIAINDGSTDDSLQVLLNLKIKYPELIVVSQENQGLGYTRNLGISMAQGKYIYFLDSDDYILPDTIQKCYKLASSHDLDMVFFDAYNFLNNVERGAILQNPDDRKFIIKERKEVFSGTYFLEKYAKIIYEPSCCFIYFSMKFLKKNRLNFLKRVYFEDNEFYCKAMNYADRIMYIPEMFYQRRCRKESITGSSFNLQKAQDILYVINKIFELKNTNEKSAWTSIKEIIRKLLFFLAEQCKNNDLYRKDNKLAIEILRIYTRIYEKKLDDFNNIEELYGLKILSETFEEDNLDKKNISDKYNKLLKEILEKLPLNKKGMSILIYGSGLYTEKWLDLYEIQVGEIEAQIGFIDSYKKDKDTKFREHPVYHVKEIDNADMIIISSPKYNDEMAGMIRELYGTKYKVISLYKDLHLIV